MIIFNPLFLTQFFSGFLILFLGLHIFFKNIRNSVNTAFFTLSIFLSGWEICGAITNALNSFSINPLLVSRISMAFSSLLSASVFIFCLELTEFKKKDLFIPISYIFAALVALYSIPGGFLKQINIINKIPERVFTSHIWILLATLLIFFLSGIIILAVNSFQLKSEKRNKLLYIFCSILLGFSFAITFSFILPLFGYNNLFFLGHLGPLAFFLITSYAIAKHKLMDITIIIKQGLAYFLTSIFAVSLIGTVFYYTNYNDAFNLISLLFIGVFLALTGQSIRKFLVTTAARVFIKGYYDPEAVFSKIAKNLFEETQREKIFKKLEDILYAELEIENEAILIAVRNNVNQLSHYQLMSKDTINTLKISKEDPLIQYFNRQTETQIMKNIEISILNCIKEKKFNPETVLIPFSSPEILEGIIILGERSGGIFYKANDYLFFQNLILHVSAFLFRLTPIEVVEKNFAVTQKKIYEAQLAYKQSEKIASISTLIKRGAHTLKNPLGVARNKVHSLLNKERSIEYLKSSQQSILKHLDIADKIIIDMLKVSEPKERVEEKINVNEVLTKIFSEFDPDASVQIYQDYVETPFILADRDQVEEIFRNIITNSFDAILDKSSENAVGEIKVSTSYELDKDNDENNSFVLIEIEDNGNGIKKEDLPRVFEAFFSTKSRGSGLGLSITYRFVRENYGEILVDSEKGKWTKFSTKFPKYKN